MLLLYVLCLHLCMQVQGGVPGRAVEKPLEHEVNERTVFNLGKQARTDKTFHARMGKRHFYQTMYGIFLAPMRHRPLKLFEIGLGCEATTKSASATLWRKLLPKGDLWFAEYNSTCVDILRKKRMLMGINVVVGDQGEPASLDRWIRKSGGNFDVIIDDGSHKSRHIFTSFQALWPTLKPGGLYFIEDLQVGRSPKLFNQTDPIVFSEVVQDWIEQLLIRPGDVEPIVKTRNPLPTRLKFVLCQHEACVLKKCAKQDIG
mmetsp:Transcript_16561/g.27900  ORF Transcript_16561/g.27900 Transcript_16561/m.27900 type:complete len:259 (-) Transcript_16561:79-855(-)